MAPRITTRTARGKRAGTQLSTVDLAALIDQVSNRLQVVLGFVQILHELDEAERVDAIASIARECDGLRATLRLLTTAVRDDEGLAPWQGVDVAGMK